MCTLNDMKKKGKKQLRSMAFANAVLFVHSEASPFDELCIVVTRESLGGRPDFVCAIVLLSLKKKENKIREHYWDYIRHTVSRTRTDRKFR